MTDLSTAAMTLVFVAGLVFPWGLWEPVIAGSGAPLVSRKASVQDRVQVEQNDAWATVLGTLTVVDGTFYLHPHVKEGGKINGVVDLASGSTTSVSGVDAWVVLGGDVVGRSVRPIRVRLTFYTDRGTTRYGCTAGPGIVAVDPEVIKPMSTIRWNGQEYLACDTGGMVRGPHIDVWMPTLASGWDMLSRYGEEVMVEVNE